MFWYPTTTGRNLFEELTRMGREMEDLFGNRAWPAGIRAAGRGAYPPINVSINANAVDVYVFAAGLDPKSIEIVLQKNLLTLSGQRQVPQIEGAEYYRQERFSGSFKRVITLPEDVNPDRVDAHYKNGVLHINIERQAPAQPKRIEVK